MKKILSILLAFGFVVSLAGCSYGGAKDADDATGANTEVTEAVVNNDVAEQTGENVAPEQNADDSAIADENVAPEQNADEETSNEAVAQ